MTFWYILQYNMEETWKYPVKWEVTKDILYDSIYIECLK